MSALAAASPQTAVGSAEAYAAELYERHRRAVFGFCYKQLRRREDADDALQTTFVYALLSLRRGVVPELELPWLFTIARNVCSTRRRAGMRRGAHEATQDLDSVQDHLASPERSDEATSEDFTAVLRAIPESQRRALLLREWRGLSYDEIGSELGLSQSATEALLFRARQNVAQRLGERTGLKAALQGLPFVSFLRNLLQSAAAKTIAPGAAAALTIVAMPAANEHVHTRAPVKTPVEARAAVRNDVAAPSAPRRRAARVQAAARSAEVGAPRRSAAHGVRRPPRAAGVVANTDTPNVTAPTPPQPTSPPVRNDVPSPSPAAVTIPAATVVVDTASDAAQSLGLPPVTVPQIDTPAVTLPVTQAPTVPSVHLP